MPLSAISNPNLFTGPGALKSLDTILPHYHKILLINDKNGFQPCGAADYFNKKFYGGPGGGFSKEPPGNHGCRKQSLQYIAYTGSALPLEDVEETYREIRQNRGIDLIIAVGGGTIIDIAKMLAIAYSNRCEKVEEIVSNTQLENRLDLIFIPTTAGTGSEATSFAVVYRDKVKLSIERKSVLPLYTVLDPLLLRSLPVPVLNSTILDALAQAIESIWAKGSTGEVKEYARQAIGLILKNLDKENSNQRLEQLLAASHLAGKAINISRTTLPHSISYPLSAHFNIAHGIAVFLTLPGVAELNYYSTENSIQEGIGVPRLRESFSLLFSLFGVEEIGALRRELSGIVEKLGFSSRLRDYGITRKDLRFLADNAFTKGRSDNNPRKLDSSQVLTLLEEIF